LLLALCRSAEEEEHEQERRATAAAAMAHSLTAVLPQLASAASSSSSSSSCSSSSSSSSSPGNHFFSLSSSLLSRMPAVAWSFSKASSFSGLSIHEAAVAAAIVTGHGNSQHCGGVSRVRGSEKSVGFRCRAAAAAATAAEAPVVSSNGAAGVSASSPEKLFGRQYFPLSAIVGQV